MVIVCLERGLKFWSVHSVVMTSFEAHSKVNLLKHLRTSTDTPPSTPTYSELYVRLGHTAAQLTLTPPHVVLGPEGHILSVTAAVALGVSVGSGHV